MCYLPRRLSWESISYSTRAIPGYESNVPNSERHLKILMPIETLYSIRKQV